MGKQDSKLFALRVQNVSRSCVLVAQFRGTDVWGLPTLVIPYEADPMNHLDDILKQIGRDDKFEMISAISLIEYTQVDSKGLSHNSIIYDLNYKGKVLPGQTTRQGNECYSTIKWMQKGTMGNLKSVNYTLHAYLRASEKETCLS